MIWELVDGLKEKAFSIDLLSHHNVRGEKHFLYTCLSLLVLLHETTWKLAFFAHIPRSWNFQKKTLSGLLSGVHPPRQTESVV